MRLTKIEPGLYETRDGRYEIRRAYRPSYVRGAGDQPHGWAIFDRVKKQLTRCPDLRWARGMLESGESE